MNSRLKILFLSRWYPPSSGTFAEKQAQAISLFCDVVVLAVLPAEPGTLVKPYLREEVDPEFGIRVIRVFYSGCRKNFRMISSPLQFLKYSMALVRGCFFLAAKKEHFDVVHVNILSRSAVPAILLKIFNGIPYVITEHWSRYLPENNNYKGFFRKQFTRFAVRHASAVTTVSGFLREAMQAKGLVNPDFIIVPNTVNTDVFVPGEKRYPSEKKRILHISGFRDNVKNTSAILRVICRAAELRTDFECRFIGGREPFRGQAVKYAAGLGILDKTVFFDGYLRNQDLAAAIRESDFLLMFSNYESFCSVIIESLSCGKPVLTSDAGGIPGYFTEECGLMTGRGDEAALFEKFFYMLDHYREFDGNKMREYVLKTFSYDVVGKQYSDLYRDAVRS